MGSVRSVRSVGSVGSVETVGTVGAPSQPSCRLSAVEVTPEVNVIRKNYMLFVFENGYFGCYEAVACASDRMLATIIHQRCTVSAYAYFSDASWAVSIANSLAPQDILKREGSVELVRHFEDRRGHGALSALSVALRPKAQRG